MYREETKKDFFKMMNQRLEDQGWENMTKFAIASKLPYSIETVRRGFTDCGNRQLGADTLAVICRYLGWNRQEIKQILQKYTDDNEIWKLIGEDTESALTPDEQALIEAYRKIMVIKPEALSGLVDSLAFVAKMADVNIDAEMKVLRRGGKRG